MLPATNKVRIARIPLDVIAEDWLNAHGKGDRSYALPPNERVLRQEAWPEDAKILFAQIEQPDTPREDALQAAKHFLDRLRGLMPNAERLAELASLRLADSVGYEKMDEALDEARPKFNALVGTVSAVRDGIAEITPLIAQIDTALATPPARVLVVGIQSEQFEPAARGSEPEHDFDPRAFHPPKQPIENGG